MRACVLREEFLVSLYWGTFNLLINIYYLLMEGMQKTSASVLSILGLAPFTAQQLCVIFILQVSLITAIPIL